MSGIDATKEKDFELVTVFGKLMLLLPFTRVDRESVPQDLYIYEVRSEDDDEGSPAEITNHVFVNFYGTLISYSEIEMRYDEDEAHPYRGVSYEDIWYEDVFMSLDEYRRMHLSDDYCKYGNE